MKRAIFLDRDGVINEVLFRGRNNDKPIAPWKMDEFKLVPGIKKPLESLSQLGFLLFIVTNQPDIAKGLVNLNTVNKMNRIIMSKFPIKEIKVCPHIDSDNCNCRKPKPGMILELSRKWKIDTEQSFLIGDNWRDMKVGKRAGCKTILLDRFYNQKIKADYKIDNLEESINIIRSNLCTSP